jgi:hypothetical protein
VGGIAAAIEDVEPLQVLRPAVLFDRVEGIHG